LLASLEQGDLLELQSAYSELFDRSRSLSLHLFEHVHGDGRERGQALIDLGQRYVESGFLLEASELPDFVPVFVEFASCLPEPEAREMLAQPGHVFAVLAERLDKRESPYAAVFQALVALGGARPAAEAMAELEAPDEDPAKIDEDWEEAPVTFSAHEMGGPTGVVAKIRAARRAVTEAIKG
jgi:nitrate reductase delta subunit